MLFMSSCSHTSTNQGISISTATRGLMKSNIAPFPIYLTDKVENRVELEKKYSSDLYLVHTGHILKPNLSKAENEKNLNELSTSGFNLVNLTLEDFLIAESQGISFESVYLPFINSSVIDLSTDDLATAKNISPFVIYGGVAFIGLSDAKLDKKYSQEKYIINDYVLSILKVKKAAIKANNQQTYSNFIIVHNLGSEINDVMLRLPPTFINSLAD